MILLSSTSITSYEQREHTNIRSACILKILIFLIAKILLTCVGSDCNKCYHKSPGF